ncbi:hypothetical protein Tco_1167773 [Tanacetum coccineum]
MKATYTTRCGCEHNVEDVCRPFGSDGSFRNWAYRDCVQQRKTTVKFVVADTIKMAVVSRTFGSDRAITAAYDKGSLAKQ